MQKQKGISTLVGIIIIVVIAIVLFGGVFAYQYFTKSQQNSEFFGSSQKTDQTQTQTADQKCIGGFLRPNKDNIKQGEEYKIEWTMPDGYVYYSIDLLLIGKQNNIIGKVLPGNWIKYNETSSWVWNAENVDPYTGEFDVVGGLNKPKIDITPGIYKLRLVYKYVDSKNCPKGQFESQEFQIIK